MVNLTPAGLFEMLSNEILLDILEILPIRDVLSLELAVHRSIPVIRTRVDPCKYLQKQGPFENALDLLDVMSSHGAVLSGSRALEWFIPGSSREASDWDFYVPPEPTSVTAIKRALERSGVIFKSCLMQASQELQEKSTVTLNRKQIISIAYEAYFSPPLPSVDHELTEAVFHSYPMLKDVSCYIQTDGSVSWIADLQPITIGRDGSVTTITSHPFDSEYYYSYHHIASTVLSGTAKRLDRTVPVQLIVGAIDPRQQTLMRPPTGFKSVLQNIFRFYASHVQCFLSKHVALHMYYKLAAEKTAYRWQVPDEIREKAEAAIQKYVQRGFQFLTAPENDGGWVPRAALDGDSFFIGLDRDHRYRPSLALIESLEWNHMGNTILVCDGQPLREARHELLHFGIIEWS